MARSISDATLDQNQLAFYLIFYGWSYALMHLILAIIFVFTSTIYQCHKTKTVFDFSAKQTGLFSFVTLRTQDDTPKRSRWQTLIYSSLVISKRLASRGSIPQQQILQHRPKRSQEFDTTQNICCNSLAAELS